MDLVDARPDGGACRRELGGFMGPGREDASTGDARFELATNGFDLGQLGHVVTVASAR